jgi:adenosylhomocysteine nucleosidase
MTRTAIIAAMPGELKPLVRGWQHERSNGVDLWRHSIDGAEWIAACAGAGVDAATRAFAEVQKLGPIDSVVSTGWAGALREDLTSGYAYSVSGVIDARTGERFQAQNLGSSVDESPRSQNHDLGHPGLWLATSPKVADAAEKRRLAATYGAGLVDMEAAGVARLAQTRGILFYCIKGISDGYSDQLPDFNRFISSSGKFKLAQFVVFVLLRPRYWPALMRMGENSKRAAQSIAASLLDFLEESGHVR